jgi:hypothetical protein
MSFLAIAFCSVPILSNAFGLVAAGKATFPSIRASRTDVRLAAATGLVLGIAGAIGAINRSVEELAAYLASHHLVIEADGIKKVD